MSLGNVCLGKEMTAMPCSGSLIPEPGRQLAETRSMCLCHKQAKDFPGTQRNLCKADDAKG